MASKKKKILVTISAALAVVAGILATSEKIINSNDAIYSKISSKIKDPVVVDILVSKVNGDVLEKFGFYDGTISNNISEVRNNEIYIKPEKDIFIDKSIKENLPIQAIHFGPYLSYNEGIYMHDEWVPSYPILDILISQSDIKDGLNVAEIRLSLDTKQTVKDDTPYLEVVGEMGEPGTLTVINQGWSKIKKAKIEYQFVGNPGDFDYISRIIENINPEKLIFNNSINLSDLENGKDIQRISFESDIYKAFGKDLRYYDKQVQRKAQYQYKLKELTKFEEEPPYCTIDLGLIGRISVLSVNPEGKTVPYTGYFRGIINLANEGGFGGGEMEVNARSIIRLKSDTSIHEYSMPITFRLDEKSKTYRTQIMLASDKTAKYNFRYSVIGQGKVLYKSPIIHAFIFVPMASGTKIYNKLYH